MNQSCENLLNFLLNRLSKDELNWLVLEIKKTQEKGFSVINFDKPNVFTQINSNSKPLSAIGEFSNESNLPKNNLGESKLVNLKGTNGFTVTYNTLRKNMMMIKPKSIEKLKKAIDNLNRGVGFNSQDVEVVIRQMKEDDVFIIVEGTENIIWK